MSAKTKIWCVLLLVGGGVCTAVMTSAVKSQSPFGSQPDRELVTQFDTDDNGWLNETERKEARNFVKENPTAEGGPGGGGPGGRGPGAGGPGRRGGPGGGGGTRGGGRSGGGESVTPTKGITIDKSDVQPATGDLYDVGVVRTIFIDFANDDWEKELEEFHGSDVDVPATLTVDGKQYPNCGIRFRGASSYGHVASGMKRSFNVSTDMADEDQKILGYKTLNLLNCHGDASMMSTVLYSEVTRNYIPAPKANLVRVVVNGEHWGIYTNVQQYNKQFLKENYGTSKKARWKVHGSPRGGGGLEYLGDDLEDYRFPYEQKSGGDKSLTKLVNLCRVLDQTPTSELPSALEPICNVEGLLWYLAIDVALQNSDGYWVRASDYSIYLDDDDKFHFLPHDMNEAFRASRGGPGGGGGPGGPRGFGGPGGGPGGPGFGGPGGPGFGGPEFGGRDGGPGGRRPGGFGDLGFDALAEEFGLSGPRGGDRRDGPRGGGGPGGPPTGGVGAASNPVGLDPLIAIEDPSKPLRSKVLAVPKYREQYLANLRQMANESLNWKSLGPTIETVRDLIDPAMKAQTRGLTSYEAFVSATASESAKPESSEAGPGRSQLSLKGFIEGRQKFLLDYKAPGNGNDADDKAASDRE